MNLANTLVSDFENLERLKSDWVNGYLFIFAP